uniref:Uncharacterized protein n=1 Tax=Trichobilharzia regenti TaxID=157069 RepID=A0AA85JBM6_TRIRE|nr:unnamed protein product [Trichobilharzia regenti]
MVASGMNFNLKKCKVVKSRTCGLQNASHSLWNESLFCTTSESDLGLVGFDTSVNYTRDEARACALTNSTRRQLGALTPKLVLSPYKTYVRPLLEGHNIIAPPLLRRDADLFERVQRRAKKRVVGLRNNHMMKG